MYCNKNIKGLSTGALRASTMVIPLIGTP